MTLAYPHLFLPVGHLFRGHQPAMIVLVTGNRRAPPLDGIGKETDRAFMVDSGKFSCHSRDAIAAKIFHQFCKFCITAPVQQGRDIALIAQILHQPFAPSCPAHIGKGRIILIGTGIYPALQFIAARLGKGSALQAAIFYAHHLPAKGFEDFFCPLP